GEHRRGPVHRDRRLIAFAAECRDARPADDSGDTNTALVKVELFPGKWPVKRKPFTAVVAGKNNESIAIEAHRSEHIENASDTVVQTLYYLGVGFERSARDKTVIAPFEGFAHSNIAGAFPRPVRSRVMQTQV